MFDCGRLKSGNPAPLLERGVTTTDMSVEAFLIVHPRGTLLWDAGVIPDELVKPEGTVEARATVHTTLKGQLAAIGYKPADITYLALSHNHYDHSANGNAFAGSTWLVQRPERAFMFPDTPPATPINRSARWSELKNSKTMILDGDYDVFGDGSVVIISTPGHTPGHQSLFVNLKKTGPVVLSGDLVPLSGRARVEEFHAARQPRRSRAGGCVEGEGRGAAEAEARDSCGFSTTSSPTPSCGSLQHITSETIPIMDKATYEKGLSHSP